MVCLAGARDKELKCMKYKIRKNYKVGKARQVYVAMSQCFYFPLGIMQPLQVKKKMAKRKEKEKFTSSSKLCKKKKNI